jgi:hypothetical protein
MLDGSRCANFNSPINHSTTHASAGASLQGALIRVWGWEGVRYTYRINLISSYILCIMCYGDRLTHKFYLSSIVLQKFNEL